MTAAKKYLVEITSSNSADKEDFDGCFIVPVEIIVSKALWFFAYCHDDYVKQPEASPIKGALHYGGIVKSVDYRGGEINVITSEQVYRFICAGVL